MTDIIAESLGIRPFKETVDEDEANDETGLESYGKLIEYNEETGAVEIVPNTNESTAELMDDVDKARKNISSILEVGQEALKGLLNVAIQSENVQAFQVAANMMETLVQSNKEFISVAEKKREIRMEDGNTGNVTKSETNITQNNLIVTPDSLLSEMLERRAAQNKKG